MDNSKSNNETPTPAQLTQLTQPTPAQPTPAPTLMSTRYLQGDPLNQLMGENLARAEAAVLQARINALLQPWNQSLQADLKQSEEQFRRLQLAILGPQRLAEIDAQEQKAIQQQVTSTSPTPESSGDASANGKYDDLPLSQKKASETSPTVPSPKSPSTPSEPPTSPEPKRLEKMEKPR